MKNTLKIPRFNWILMLTLLTATLFSSCSPEQYKQTTDETLNITEFLRESPEYSLFLEVLDQTNYASFMNTYGTYTLFLPTNEAIQNYLTDNGYSTVKEIPLTDLQELAKLHILKEKVPTTEFTDGKISAPSMQGQYLITGAINDESGSSVVINKTSKIVASNLEVGNGVIHVVDQVLNVATKTLAEAIDEDPSLSIFSEAIKITGWYDALNEPLIRQEQMLNDEILIRYLGHLTVLAQTDEVFAEAGINDLEALKLKYSHLNDPTNPADSLNLFVAYRIIPQLSYMADLAVTPAVLTKAPLEVIGVKLVGDSILLNEETFNGVLEKGVEIDRSESDITVSNGVYHTVKENFFIKKRVPAPVYFDVADQPEFRQLAGVFRVPGMSISLSKEELADVTWEGNNKITYQSFGIGSTSRPAWHGDVLEMYRLRDNYINNIEFTTPVIIKGQYKVWVSYRQSGSAASSVRTYFDDVPLTRLFSFREYGSTSTPERVLESQGYKRHITPFTSRYNSRLLGVINVETTGRHKIKFQSLTNAGQQSWIDVVEFRPIDMDQLYPKFEAGGDGLIEQ